MGRADEDLFDVDFVVGIVLEVGIGFFDPGGAFGFDGMEQTVPEASAHEGDEETAELEIEGAFVGIVVEPVEVSVGEAGAEAVAEAEFEEVFLVAFGREYGVEFIGIGFVFGAAFVAAVGEDVFDGIGGHGCSG